MFGKGFSRFLLAALLACVSQSPAYAENTVIPAADDLAGVAAVSAQQRLPVVVFVSREACPYCRTLRSQVLGPMLGAGKFDRRAILVEVNLDRSETMTGFDGNPVSAQEFAAQYKAKITPTLLFLDENGRQLSKPRIGISNLELYGFYLERSIQESLVKMGESA